MKMISKLAAAATIATLTACGGGRTEEDTGNTLEANTLVVDNLSTGTDMNMDMNMDTNVDMNATDNAIAADLTTNSPDANLANGI